MEEADSSPASPDDFGTVTGRVYFDEAGYVAAGTKDADPYVRNRFNQAASDNLPSNRNVPDTRNAM